jgi:hypothetical protein
MSIEEKLVEKFGPHAKRIQNGQNNEYDFLPAALLENLKADRESLARLQALINASGDQAKTVKKGIDAIANQVVSSAETTQDGVESIAKQVGFLKILTIVNIAVSIVAIAAIVFLKR